MLEVSEAMMTKTPDLLILTEASPQIGHGHVMRCLALAEEARERGLAVSFLAEDEYLIKLVRSFGETIIDNVPYRLSPRFVIRDFRKGSSVTDIQRHLSDGSLVLLLDELGQARTVASVVVNAMMTPPRVLEYPNSSQTKYLYGLRYAAIQNQFRENHANANPGQSLPGRLFVSFGGSDPLSITVRFLQALGSVGFKGPTTIVTDHKNFHCVEQVVRVWHDTEVLTNVTDMAQRTKACDLVATKLGVTVLEVFCVGLGCVLLEPTPAHLDLQLKLMQEYAPWAAIDFGQVDRLDFPEAARKTVELLHDSNRLSLLGRQAAELVDGLGVKRIIDELVALE